MTSKDFDQNRLQDLADNISQDQELLKEYEDSLHCEQDPRRRKECHKNIELLTQSITKQKQEYADLKERINRIAIISGNQPISSPKHKASPQYPPLLFDLLLQINFKKQFRLVKTAIDQHQTIGFLVHGELNCGQQMLVNRLYLVKPIWQNHKPIAIDVSSNAVGSNLKKLWGRVAGC